MVTTYLNLELPRFICACEVAVIAKFAAAVAEHGIPAWAHENPDLGVLGFEGKDDGGMPTMTFVFSEDIPIINGKALVNTGEDKNA